MDLTENFDVKEEESTLQDAKPEEATGTPEPEEAIQSGGADDASATDEAAGDGTDEAAKPDPGQQEEEAEEQDADEAADQQDGGDEAGASDEGKKDGRIKGFFKKKDKKDELIADLQDRVKRQMAEFENFRKRSDKEKSQMYDMGARSMLEKILPVMDNFERGLDGLPEESKDPFADGMKMVYKQLVTALTDAGVKEIEAIGCAFDPELHNAVMHIDDDQFGENEIVEVFEKGYTYHDTVVRHSMVKVAN